MSGQYAIDMLVMRLHDLMRRDVDFDASIVEHEADLARVRASKENGAENMASLRKTLGELGIDPDEAVRKRIASLAPKCSPDSAKSATVSA